MANLSQITTAIDSLLGLSAAGRILQLNSNTCERAYEAYVLALCATAVRNCGGQAELTGIISGSNPSPVVFRGASGSMASQRQNFCYLSCTMGNKSLEIHLDVEYIGQSGARHEIDVSIYDAPSAAEVRKGKAVARTNKPLIVAIECKFYKSSTPRVELGRTFVGLLNDCTKNKLSAFVSNRSSAGLDLFLAFEKNSIEPFTDLDALNSDSENRFVRYLEQVLRKWELSR